MGRNSPLLLLVLFNNSHAVTYETAVCYGGDFRNTKTKTIPLEDGGVVADLDALLSRCQYVGAEARWP